MKSRALFSGLNAAVAALVFAILYAFIGGNWIGAAAITAAAPGKAVPDLLFSYDPAALGPMFANLGEAGRAAYLRMNALDFFFAASYGLLFLITLGWAAGRLFPKAPAPRWIGAIGVLAAAADEAENVVFRMIASSSIAGDGSVAAFASGATTLKFVCFYAATALAAAALVALGVKRALSPSAAR
jgi:hypothetical protein